MIDYYSDVYQNGGNYWADFRNDQLVYGHKVGETNNEIYVIDLDSSNIAIGNYDISNKSVSNERLFQQLISVAYSITQAEGKIPDKSHLMTAREALLSKLSLIPNSESHYQILQEARQLLERS